MASAYCHTLQPGCCWQTPQHSARVFAPCDQLTGAPAGTSTCDERELDALRRFHAPFNAALWAHMRAHYADESALVEAAAARDESVREHLTWLIDAR